MPLSIAETKERLRELELFRDCGDVDLDRVAAVARNVVRFEPGDVLYEEGDPARDCYFIVEGEAEITVSGRFIGSSGPGESVGEMGLLHRGPRTATVVARTPVTVQVIEAAGFARLLDEAHSVTRALLRQVSRRLADRSETVARLAALADEKTVEWDRERPSATAGRPSRIALDPDAPGFFQSPYAQYAVLREHEPVHYDEAQETWLISRYEDVLRFARNKDLTVELQHATPSAYVDKERARPCPFRNNATEGLLFSGDLGGCQGGVPETYRSDRFPGTHNFPASEAINIWSDAPNSRTRHVIRFGRVGFGQGQT